jgi:signal transduction histidine kinase
MLMPIYAIGVLSYLGLTLYELIRKRKQAPASLKSQINFMLVGIALTFILAVITNFLFVILFQITNLVAFGPAYSLILVGFIGYAIIKHRFLDMGLLIFRTVTFTIVTIIIILVYALALFSFLKYVPSDYQNLLTILLALVLVYSYNPLKSVIELFTKNIFYKQPYSTEKLLETLGETIRSTLTLETLGKNTLKELVSSMHITHGALIVNQENSKHAIVHHGYLTKPNFSDNTLHNLTNTVKGKIVAFDDLEESPTKMLLRQESLAVIMPLKVKSTQHGLLVLGEKASGEIYSQQDIDVLEILIPQLSVAIQNAKSYEEIKGFADTLKVEVANATADLKKANKDLRHLDKLKDEFVFIATHELKNPVTAMRGYLSMLQEGSFGIIPDKMRDPVDQLQMSNQQLVDLVNDLLQIARSEAKTITINTTPTKLSDTVNLVLENVKPLVDQKHLELHHECPKDSLMVNADEQRLKEIINNLVSNAIKYSDKGTITISYDHKGNDIITKVTDCGAGIADKDKDKIFTRFFRVEEEAAKGIPGTGLGLFIVKQLIEKMGGKIWFESQYGVGTTFFFSLPKA